MINLLKEFIKELRALLNEHLKLFKQDLTENSFNIVKALVALAVALLIGYVGLIFLGLLFVSLFSMLIPKFTALLLVTAMYFGIPLILMVYAINLFHKVFKQPKKSIEELEKTMDEAKTWMKNLKK